MSAKAGPTVLSEDVKPRRSTLVESESSSSTPRFPYSAKAVRSIGPPPTGVWSILKSAVWITYPAGVSTASETHWTVL